MALHVLQSASMAQPHPLRLIDHFADDVVFGAFCDLGLVLESILGQQDPTTHLRARLVTLHHFILLLGEWEFACRCMPPSVFKLKLRGIAGPPLDGTVRWGGHPGVPFSDNNC